MISVIDYGMGNLFSVKKQLQKIKKEVIITNSPELIKKSKKIILPGVGNFKKAMLNLKTTGLYDILNREVMVNKKPVLGICLGMQIMCNESEEGNAQGFGWINGNVKKFVFKNVSQKIPHMGWNKIKSKKSSTLISENNTDDEYYFVHSYFLEQKNMDFEIAITDYINPFVSVIEKNNIFGTQFHPEKSHSFGFKILRNFIEYNNV